MAIVGPVRGGCWYCGDDDGDMYFCWEFDCYIHIECLERELQGDWDDPERDIIASEFSEVLKQRKSQREGGWA